MHNLKQDLQKIFNVFMGQLRLLFGLKSDNLHAADSGISSFLASERGFAEWWENFSYSFFLFGLKICLADQIFLDNSIDM